MNLFVNKFRNPTTKNFVWPETLSTNSTISKNQKMKSVTVQKTGQKAEFFSKAVRERVKLWDYLNSTYDFNQIFGLPSLNKQIKIECKKTPPK